MYLRESKRRNKDGSTVSYLQLAHNERHPRTGSPVARVIHNFGRADKVDIDALRRLVASISRFLEPTGAPAGTGGGAVEIVDSRRMGGAFVLDGLWDRLGIGAALRAAAAGRRIDADTVERIVFALVAQRCLQPGSKLAAVSWAAERVALPGNPIFDDQAAYAAMDFLLDALPAITRSIFESTAHLLNLTCDVIFVDTSSTYWEVDVADEAIQLSQAKDAQQARAAGGETAEPPVEAAIRQFSKHSKDHRTDLPQVVIAMAVTAEGVQIRCWTFPGRSSDKTIIARVKADMNSWSLGRLVWVTDSGFNSAANRVMLQGGGDSYVVAEPLRSAPADTRAALARPGRYKPVTGNPNVKEVMVGTGVRAQRFCVCLNPDAAGRDKTVRANIVAHLEQLIDGTDAWSVQRRDELVGHLKATPALHRFVRRTAGAERLLRIDKAAIAADARYDGKWVLRTSDTTLTATDLAVAYKQLTQVEHGWRDLKGSLKLRPVFHHREDRIRAHIQLCWLALLLIRVAENATGDTWRNLRNELDRMHLVTIDTADGRIAQRTAITAGQHAILAALQLREPGLILDYQLPEAARA